MKNLTTPQAILFGFGMIAIAIVISSYAPNSIIKEAQANTNSINSTLINNNRDIVNALNGIAKNIKLWCGN